MDDGDVREVLALLLQARGATVLTAASVTEALAAISQDKLDVLLADIRMPDEDGYSLIAKLRAEERGQQDGHLAAM
jgi:CheY-like chemotaxis protein